jgi:hypothetical protein
MFSHNNNNKGLRSWGEGVILTHPRGIDTDIQPLYTENRSSVKKSHILQEVAPFDVLTEHGRSRGAKN